MCIIPLIAGSSSAADGSIVTGSQERRRRWGSAKQRSGSTSATTISSDVLKVLQIDVKRISGTRFSLVTNLKNRKLVC